MTTLTQGIYDALDPFKVKAMKAAATTRHNMERLGFEEIEWSRGESCYLFRHKGTGLIMGLVVEGLGTKNRVAEDPQLRVLHFSTFYDQIAICNAAMNVNDVLTVGALPLVFALHPAIGGGGVLGGTDGEDLINGNLKAAELGGYTWGPGETPSLSGIITPGTLCLSGATVAFVRHEAHLMNWRNVRAGLRIVTLASSGIHANGLTDARGVADKLPEGFRTRLPNGRTYGEELLTPTTIYRSMVERCQDERIPLVYAVNVTGHGWRKLMRPSQSLTYVIDRAPPIPDVFDFIMRNAQFDHRKMFETFNMGIGFALFVDPEHVSRVLKIAEETGHSAVDAGNIVEGDRKVVIAEHGIELDELTLR